MCVVLVDARLGKRRINDVYVSNGFESRKWNVVTVCFIHKHIHTQAHLYNSHYLPIPSRVDRIDALARNILSIGVWVCLPILVCVCVLTVRWITTKYWAIFCCVSMGKRHLNHYYYIHELYVHYTTVCIIWIGLGHAWSLLKTHFAVCLTCFD